MQHIERIWIIRIDEKIVENMACSEFETAAKIRNFLLQDGDNIMKKMCRNRHVVLSDECIDRYGRPIPKIFIPDKCTVCGEKMENI